MPAMVFCLTMKVKRGETFVTRKITRGLSRIHLGLDECIYMGNLNSEEIGNARDYLRCNG